MEKPGSKLLSRPQYRALALMRNHMGVGGLVHGRTINSLRRRGLIREYSLEITEKGEAVMDLYSATSL